jgi:pyruvate-ferredoxin/flavodoxin oxidoreductase
MLCNLEEGGTFLLTTAFDKDTVWNELPKKVQQDLIEKKAKFYIIDAVSLGLALGLGARINMIMQTAFFMISGILTEEEAIAAIKNAIKKTYGKKGDKVVQMNYDAVDGAIKNIVQVSLGADTDGQVMPAVVPEHAPKFVQEVTAKIIEGNGAKLTTSQIPDDGTWPTATTQYEKRNIAVAVPQWVPDNCIQCGQCALVCPHAACRVKIAPNVDGAPKDFLSRDAIGKAFKDQKFALQIFTQDCCGCTLCVSVCPAKTKALVMKPNNEELKTVQAENVDFFLSLPEINPADVNLATIKGSQLMRPLFEFSGACAGCGETPYIKLISQLFGDRMYIGNATGCSSIYGGNLPTTPYSKREDGRGPTWANSLFEDCAEFSAGMRTTVNKLRQQAEELLGKCAVAGLVSKELCDSILEADQTSQMDIEAQRSRVAELDAILAKSSKPEAKRLLHTSEFLVKKSVWGFGGDGWAYDIGYGGVDHVLASGENVNLLVLDTEVYSNTGGQMSKSTPRAATAQFASSGKKMPKKNMGMIFATYGNVYVAQISIGANPTQAIKAIVEAEAYDGPSLIIAYSHCINHGINMALGLEQQKKAVACGHWPLYRFNPELEDQGKNPLIIDSKKEPSISFEEYALGENRYRILKRVNPEKADQLLAESQKDVLHSWRFLKSLAAALEPEPEETAE